jgi:hypothetical protein
MVLTIVCARVRQFTIKSFREKTDVCFMISFFTKQIINYTERKYWSGAYDRDSLALVNPILESEMDPIDNIRRISDFIAISFPVTEDDLMASLCFTFCSMAS